MDQRSEGRATRPRFIAGAVCPRCGDVDRLVMEMVEGARRRRCVSCGFADDQVPTAAVAPSTRFAPRGPAEPDPEPVRLLDD